MIRIVFHNYEDRISSFVFKVKFGNMFPPLHLNSYKDWERYFLKNDVRAQRRRANN